MGLLMDRRWIQAVFVYTGRALPASSAADTISPRPPGVLPEYSGIIIKSSACHHGLHLRSAML